MLFSLQHTSVVYALFLLRMLLYRCFSHEPMKSCIVHFTPSSFSFTLMSVDVTVLEYHYCCCCNSFIFISVVSPPKQCTNWNIMHACGRRVSLLFGKKKKDDVMRMRKSKTERSKKMCVETEKKTHNNNQQQRRVEKQQNTKIS